MKDRRSVTSRRNLGRHVQAPLGKGKTVSVAVRLPPDLVEKLDRARGEQTRSEHLRALIAESL